MLSSSLHTNGITSSYSDRACRTILNCEQNESKGSTHQLFVLNQAIKKYFNEEAHRRARLSKINIYKVFSRISSNQGPFFSDLGKFL